MTSVAVLPMGQSHFGTENFGAVPGGCRMTPLPASSTPLKGDGAIAELVESGRGRTPQKGTRSSGKPAEAGKASQVPPRAQLPARGAKPGERAAPAPKSNDAIVSALKNSAANKDAEILVMGYSPTGGGHTDRLLNVVHERLNQQTLKPGSTVVMHIPEQWDGKARPDSLTALATRLKNSGIKVIVAQADKSVYGYLRPDGGSDDPKIIERFTNYPKRFDTPAPKVLREDRAKQDNGPTITNIAQARVYEVGDENAFKSIPVISAKELMTTLSSTIGSRATGTKVSILTDMDPYLQKAAKNVNVPAEKRTDQQNHAILLDLDNIETNLVARKALLAKVLGGTRERVSHIELGEKSTLARMSEAADTIGVTADMTRAQAREKVAAYVLEHGNRDFDATKKFEGIIVNEDLTAAEVKNVVYVYAHNHTNRIAEHIRERVAANAKGYEETLFIFCGKAVTGVNAMHAAYLAEGDGITVAGAGTTGEFSYLHKSGDSRANLMVFPIEGHNEQQANVDYLTRDEATQRFVSSCTVDSSFPVKLDAYIRRRDSEAPEKYGNQSDNMAPMLTAIASEASYVRQTHDISTGRASPQSVEMQTSDKVSEAERQMRESKLLKGNLHVLKMVFQGLDHLENVLDAADEAETTGGTRVRDTSRSRRRTDPISVKLTAKDADDKYRFANMHQFITALGDDQWLSRNMADGEHLHAGNVLLLSEARFFFRHAAEFDRDVCRDQIRELKEKYGHELTTGF